MTTRVFKGGHKNKGRNDHGWGRKQATTINELFSSSVDSISETDFDIHHYLEEIEERERKIKEKNEREKLLKQPPSSPPKKQRSNLHQSKHKAKNYLPERRRHERRIGQSDLKANEIYLDKLMIDEDNTQREKEKQREFEVEIEKKKLAEDILKKREIRKKNDAERIKLKEIINSTKYSRQSTWRESRDKYIASKAHGDIENLVKDTESNLIDFIEQCNENNPIIGTIDGKFVVKRHAHIEVESFHEQKEFSNKNSNATLFRSPFE